MKKNYLWLLLLCSFTAMKAQTTYYSKATATDFTDVSSWGTYADGTGTSPSSISNADNFVIRNASAMTLPSNASVRQLTIIDSGSLTVSANTLTVSIANANNSNLTISGGTLTVSDGNVVINGYLNYTSGNFNQSGGVIIIDPNNAGATATSTTSSQYTLNITSSTGVNWTGGTLVLVDPPASTSSSHYSIYYSSPVTSEVSLNHTLKFGDGVSTDAGGNAIGFYLYSSASYGKLNYGNVEINNPSGTNRIVKQYFVNSGIRGNLTITAGELDQTSVGLILGGDLVNNGIFTASHNTVLAMPSGTNFVTNTVAQTITGNGVFRDSTTPSANFYYLTINNSSAGGVTFANANSLLSGANTGTVSGILTFTNGVVNVGSNVFVLGVSGYNVGALSYTAGGFSSGSTFSRWYSWLGQGTPIAASTVPSYGPGTYPFVTGVSGSYNANHFHRDTAKLTSPGQGQMAVKFNGATGNSPISPITEGILTYDRQTNANWVVTTSSGYASNVNHTFAIQGQGTYISASPNVTILNNGALVGTAQTGTVQPMGERTAVPPANVAATYTLASIAAEAPIESAQSGPWESASTWVGGVVPSCMNVIILSGHTVDVSSSTTATAKNIIINSGGTLAVSGGSITVGCTNNNNSLNNEGTLSLSGGTLNLNGNYLQYSGGTLNQSAGDFNIDGNANGVPVYSVASGTSLFNVTATAAANLNLTGGTITIVDPHANTSTLDYAVRISQGGNYNQANSVHTFKFGNGASVDAGGSIFGFYVYLSSGSYPYSLGNVIVDSGTGTNRHVTTTSTIPVLGNLTIASGDFRAASALSLKGNLVNNGTFTGTSIVDFADYVSGSTAVNATAQSVSGSGVFRNSITTSTANFTSVTINNSSSTGVTFSNANSLLSGTNTGTVSGTLTMTTGFVNTGANALVLGTSATSNGTLTYTAGGFATGSTFARWWPTTTGGATITASTTPSGMATGVYPFAIGTSTAFVARNFYLNQTTAATTGGKIAVQYNDAIGTSTVSIVDGTYTVDTRSNGNWVVSQTGITGTSAYSMAINGQNIYNVANGNSRITLASAPALGTHQAGTIYVNAQRIAVPLANLADTYYLGVSLSDIPHISVTNGDWSNAATWNKGTVPTCTDIVQISAGTTVTATVGGGISKNVTINSGGTLTIVSGDLTIGCTTHDNFLTNNGTLNVSGGTLNINGNIAVNSAAKFNQSGGNINVDGNNGGSATGSVASGTYIVSFAPAANTDINLTGGTFTIVDPHYATTDTFSCTIPTVGSTAATGTHTFRFGNGISTDNGGTNGFAFYSWAGAGIFKFNNVVLETVTGGTNRFFLVNGSNRNTVINGDLTINAGAEFRNSGTSTFNGASYFTGNIINNGTFTTIATVFLADATSSSSTALTVSAGNKPQTISGSGIFRNLTASPTANLTSLTVNNSNTTGVTLNVPLSVSGTLTLTTGKVNTTSTNLLTLGTATSAGTLSGGSNSSYITGPFARTIANSNTSYIHYPVGKAAYAPVWLNPATTSVSNMKAEVFDINSGTASANIANLSTIRRWEAPLVSGAFSTINVKLGESAIGSTSLPVIAPTASGVYDNLFGNMGTYVVGTPNTIQSTTALAAASYTGYLSYAEIAAALSTSESTPVAKRISVYPNPFADLLTISDIKDVKSIMISDMSGKIVKTIDKPETTLRLGDLNAGMYLVILNMKDGSRQIVKAIKK